MSGLIVSRQAKKPFLVPEIGLNIYSMEELAYFLYDYIAIVERDFFGPELVEYIGMVLGQKAAADRLRDLREKHGTVGDMVMLIAKSSGYYSEAELLGLQKLLDRRKNTDETELLKEKAYKLAEIKQYVPAINTYKECLKRQESGRSRLTPGFFGNVWYQLGCIYSRLLQLEEAEKAFVTSASLCEDRTCLQKLFYVYRMQENEAAIGQMQEKWHLSEGMIKEWENVYQTTAEETEKTIEVEEMSIDAIKEQYRREHGYQKMTMGG